MPKDSVAVGDFSTQAEISLEVDRILGIGGPVYPRLTIPLEFTLRPSSEKTFTLLWLKTGLYLEDNKIGECVSDPLSMYSWPHLSPHNTTIEIPLDLYRIEKIEERRRGDINFKLVYRGAVVFHSLQPETDRQKEFPIKYTYFGREIQFTIPQSHWADKILPGLGYGKVKIIEIPIPEKILPDAFKEYEDELGHANEYFRQGDYDKAVAHCRSALELFNPERRDFLKELLTNSSYDWVKGIGLKTYEWIDTIFKSTRNISSKSHHPPSIGHFSRFEAQSILMVTVALLSYCAPLVTQEKKT